MKNKEIMDVDYDQNILVTSLDDEVYKDYG
jgi:hypothetical protein